jgi:hypothetical protein
MGTPVERIYIVPSGEDVAGGSSDAATNHEQAPRRNLARPGGLQV